MDAKIFLQSFNSKSSSNTSEGLNVGLKGKRKLLPLTDTAKVISQYDQYREERENCNIIRLTCQVNPICSNVLFNRISEIVKNEGSSGVSFINYGVEGLDTSDPCKYREYRDGELFDGIVYKPKKMSFWSGGTMHYQGDDSDIKDLDSNQSIDTAIKQFKEHSSESSVSSNASFHPTNSIRDMQLSNETTSFVYHCGLDIFNNHLIRSKTFKTVCKMPSLYSPDEYDDEYEGFNTIVDIMRDVSGDKVVEKVYFPPDAHVQNNARLTALHLYEYDDLYTFNDSIKKKLVKKYNGWVGFENMSKIKSYVEFINDSEMEIERPLMYMNGGDFIDMYPGRDLYSFVPKYNKYRKRIEKNWNFCLTYPSSSYTPSLKSDPFSDIFEISDGINSMKAIYFDENTRSDNGTSQLVIYGIAKHGLSKGDHVNIYKTYSTYKYWINDEGGNRISEYFDNEYDMLNEFKRLSGDSQIQSDCDDDVEQRHPSSTARSETMLTMTKKILENAEVSEIVDDYIYTVFGSDIQISSNWVYLSENELKGISDIITTANGVEKRYRLDRNTRRYFQVYNELTGIGEEKYFIVNGSYVNIDDTAQRISYKKVVNGIECDYYIRIFSKIPNFKFASGDTLNEYQIYKDGGRMISEYQKRKYDFENHISRLAFAKNVYTDEIGEVVFTDNIDISKLHDNLGRPITNIYMTFIKNNKGYKEWYGYGYRNNDWNVNEISEDSVEYSHAFGKITCGIKASYESTCNQDINCINKINNIGGDGDPTGYVVGGVINDSNRKYRTSIQDKEVSIDDVEVWYDTDTNFYGDLCYYDNYNAVERHVDYVMHRFNTAQRESRRSSSYEYFSKFFYDEIKHDDYDSSNEYSINALNSSDEFGTCNDKKEGYYYIPHYEISIKTFGKLQSLMPDFLNIRRISMADGGGSNTYRFTTLQKHFLSIGDKAILFDSSINRYYTLISIGSTKDNYNVFTCNSFDYENGTPCEIENLDKGTLSHFKLFKMDNLGCPSYCKVLKDGTCRVIWRDVLNNGFNLSDNTVEEYPFTNGAFYINKKIDIYVRRQDPHGAYRLYDSVDIEGNITDLSEEDNYIKEQDIEC